MVNDAEPFIEEFERENDEPNYFETCPEWWLDLYTDATGQCFSDADPSL